MNNGIIHISDLHISDQSGVFGKPNLNTLLKVEEGNTNSSFITHFTEYVKSVKVNKKVLIITGDITNIAEEIEFKEAVMLISLLIEQLGVLKKDVLIIPGDHDVHRDSIRNLLRQSNKATIDELQKAKLSSFSKFYKAIKDSEFKTDSLIFDVVEIDDILLLGVNSNFNINQNGGNGFLPIQKFEEELMSIKEQHSAKELIVCLHHNLEGEHEDTHFGQWESDNKKDVVSILERNNIKCIFNGNEHTPNSKNISGTDIIVSDCGSFSSLDGGGSSFKIYEVKNDGKNLSLLNNNYGLRKINGVSESKYGSWVKYDSKEIKSTEIDNFVLRRAPSSSKQEVMELPISVQEETTSQLGDDVSLEFVVYNHEIIQNKLYKIVKDKKLFHQGHFHWSETSRAHNWIDIARLLEDGEDLYFINNAIIDVIERMNLKKDLDLVIGLGYEGNIMASKASIKYNLPYTFLPYSYRWKDHNEFENKLNFENSDKKYKKVLLVTDVVNDGRTIRKLVGKESREKKFFDNVEKIIVVSLFYTGEGEVNNDILNYDKLSPKQKEGDEFVNNIEFYTIKHLKVEKCPYGENYKSECFILRDNLHCVHKFYTE